MTEYGDGLVRFRSEGLNGIQTRTAALREEYNEIWSNVHARLMGLVEQGQVDAGIAEVLNTRDEQFRREAGSFDEGVGSQNQAIRDVQNIGIEGGAAMRRAAGGRG
ncbi:hypothetical protein [Streptomyces mayteni]